MINLHEKFAAKMPKFFLHNSYLDGRLNDEYKFIGVKTVSITIPQTVPLTDYTRSGRNRYGEAHEVQDTVQEMTIKPDRGFDLTVDKGNNSEQDMMKSTGKILQLQLKKVCIPEADTYKFEKLFTKAGTIADISTKPTKDNIADLISDGTAVLDENEVPEEDRTLFVTPETYKLLKHSPLYQTNDELARGVVLKGQVGEYDNMPVIKVPAKRMPKGALFLIVHKDSATAPTKINETKLYKDPPGVSGYEIQGRFIYDCFVLEPTAMGIYAAVNSTAKKVCKAPSIAPSTGVITPDSGATVVYTTDGSDPRYSKSAITGGTASGGRGTLVRAYNYKEGQYDSPVVEAVLTA